jgi:hypothetical protein
MKWFNNWFAKKCKQAWDDSQYEKEAPIAINMGSRSNSVREGLSSEPLRFNVYNARGGKIVEVKNYDSIRDRSNSTTYIITDQQDFTEELAKIISMESLKS